LYLTRFLAATVHSKRTAIHQGIRTTSPLLVFFTSSVDTQHNNDQCYPVAWKRRCRLDAWFYETGEIDCHNYSTTACWPLATNVIVLGGHQWKRRTVLGTRMEYGRDVLQHFAPKLPS